MSANEPLRLLAAALAGKTDAELSAELDLSIEAIKKRWMSVFARVEEFKPEILSTAEIGNGRGPQKRHRVVPRFERIRRNCGRFCGALKNRL